MSGRRRTASSRAAARDRYSAPLASGYFCRRRESRRCTTLRATLDHYCSERASPLGAAASMRLPTEQAAPSRALCCDQRCAHAAISSWCQPASLSAAAQLWLRSARAVVPLRPGSARRGRRKSMPSGSRDLSHSLLGLAHPAPDRAAAIAASSTTSAACRSARSRPARGSGRHTVRLRGRTRHRCVWACLAWSVSHSIGARRSRGRTPTVNSRPSSARR